MGRSEPTNPGGPDGWGRKVMPAAVRRWLAGSRKDARDKDRSGPADRFRNVCISRQAGAGGGSVARMVGVRLGWKVYDHELLEAIAQGMEVPAEAVRPFDELAPSVIQDWFLPLWEEHYAPQEAYLDHLAKLVDSIGKAGDSILVGRGAAFLLPRSETLSIRLIAPLKSRARRLAQKMGVSPRTARRAARDLDARSRKFVRTLHRVDSDDPGQYDLVVDTDSLGLTMASDLVAGLVESGRVGAEGVGSARSATMS